MIGGVTGKRIDQAFVLFDQGKKIGDAAMSLKVTYATARVWWFQWRIADLEEQVETLEATILTMKQEQ